LAGHTRRFFLCRISRAKRREAVDCAPTHSLIYIELGLRCATDSGAHYSENMLQTAGYDYLRFKILVSLLFPRMIKKTKMLHDTQNVLLQLNLTSHLPKLTKDKIYVHSNNIKGFTMNDSTSLELTKYMEDGPSWKPLVV
jgi:hypothetical protein